MHGDRKLEPWDCLLYEAAVSSPGSRRSAALRELGNYIVMLGSKEIHVIKQECYSKLLFMEGIGSSDCCKLI